MPKRGTASPAEPFVRRIPTAQIRDTSDLLVKSIRARVRPYQLSLNQYRLLREVWDQDGVSQRIIAKRMGTSESATVATIDSLVARNLVRRTVDPNDRRRSLVVLAAKGYTLRDKIITLNDELNRQALHGIAPSEITLLTGILDRVIENLRPETSD